MAGSPARAGGSRWIGLLPILVLIVSAVLLGAWWRELDRARALGARVVRLRKLQDAAMRKIDASSASFWAAARPGEKDAAGLGLMERQRVRTWLKGAYQELDAAEA